MADAEYKEDEQTTPIRDRMQDPSNDIENEEKERIMFEFQQNVTNLLRIRNWNSPVLENYLKIFNDHIHKTDISQYYDSELQELYSLFLDYLVPNNDHLILLIKIIKNTIQLQNRSISEYLNSIGLLKSLHDCYQIDNLFVKKYILSAIAYLAYQSPINQKNVTLRFPIEEMKDSFINIDDPRIRFKIVYYFYACSKYTLNSQEIKVMEQVICYCIDNKIVETFDNVSSIARNLMRFRMEPELRFKILLKVFNLVDYSPTTTQNCLFSIGDASKNLEMQIIPFDLDKVLEYLGEERDDVVAASAAYCISMLAHNRPEFFVNCNLLDFAAKVMDLYDNSPMVPKFYVSEVVIALSHLMNQKDLFDAIFKTSLVDIITFNISFKCEKADIIAAIDDLEIVEKIFQSANLNNEVALVRSKFEDCGFVDIVENLIDRYSNHSMMHKQNTLKIDQIMSAYFSD
ncbi:hypothetical protein TVAG_070470 [Trichomonas vaginalis G3]|uniref:Uncharacterized protein n=1 Tax=Trichomonas vaginalis (strain ATCC PRA-98 / G3) TaxID=412133 RepID=A2D7V1_TRIV3|nr:armadillo (ARM) repeat-containing protein family [Trichomonas vaginalis G3]EAY23384.1 hypothetical protein TVAG_070470 [Trichomonas vaginalis G3]KAI5493798.1 armadillo (ARM) repeat-containing protein family [Trichomonas vaginalis G3]|eukprot:XP_001584370.1 hypothetical protein [Trichomonas vaginalis G3]